MPKIEVIAPASEDGSPISGYMTQILCDGQELKHVRSLQMDWRLDDVVTARIEQLACHGTRWEANAHVEVKLVAQPGYVVIAEPQPDGSTRYRVEEEQLAVGWVGGDKPVVCDRCLVTFNSHSLEESWVHHGKVLCGQCYLKAVEAALKDKP